MLLRLLRRLWVERRAPARVCRPRSRPRLEGLEDRVLMASGVDVFWNFHANIATVSNVSVPFQSGDLTGPGKQPLIGFLVLPAPGSGLDPTAVGVTQNGAAVVPALATNNTGGNLASLTLARVRSRALAVALGAAGGTTGAYQLELFLAGDVDGNNKVKQSDLNLISAALGQVQGNPGYRVEADVDRNGTINQADLDLAQSNLNARAKPNPLAVSLSIDPADDPDGDGIVAGTTVRLNGVTSKKATVRLDANADGAFEQTVRASKKNGRFRFTADIGTGNVTLLVEAANSKGQTARQQLTMLRGGGGGTGRTITGDVLVTTEAQLQALSDVSAITGSLTIFGTSLTNLSALSRLRTVGGSLTINENRQLASLQGLGSLTTVGGDLEISVSPQLTSLQGLGALTTVGGRLRIETNTNPALTTLSGLDNVTRVGGLLIRGNSALTTLSALSRISGEVGDLFIGESFFLPNLVGLGGITRVTGNFELISNTRLLAGSLTSLEGILRIGGNARIRGNSGFSDADAHAYLDRRPQGVGGTRDIQLNGS